MNSLEHKYNTQLKKLPLPEYGRSVQNMVDHCMTIESRKERQACAETIVNIMANQYPELRGNADFVPMLWDHLALMADYRLDIDYPCEILKKDEIEPKPHPVPNLQGPIRYRHYGVVLERLIIEAAEYPDNEERDMLVAMICNQMRKFLMNWNKEICNDDKIAADLEELSFGRLVMTQNVLAIMHDQQQGQHRNTRSNKNQRNRNAGSNKGQKNSNAKRQGRNNNYGKRK